MAMRRLILATVIVLACGMTLPAQTDRLETFQASFASSNLQTKLEAFEEADEGFTAKVGRSVGR